MVYIKLSISIWKSPKKATFFCKPSGNIANHGNMFIVSKCHTRSLIRILYDGIYWRVFYHVHTHFPNTFQSFVKPSWISQRSAFRWSCGVDNPQGQAHSIKIRSLALYFCVVFYLQVWQWRLETAATAHRSLQPALNFTVCCCHINCPWTLALNLTPTATVEGRWYLCPNKRGFSVLILAGIQVIPRWFVVPSPIYTPDPLGKGQVCMGCVTAKSRCYLNTLWPILRQRGRRERAGLKREGTLDTVRTTLCL